MEMRPESTPIEERAAAMRNLEEYIEITERKLEGLVTGYREVTAMGGKTTTRAGKNVGDARQALQRNLREARQLLAKAKALGDQPGKSNVGVVYN